MNHEIPPSNTTAPITIPIAALPLSPPPPLELVVVVDGVVVVD
jgi:hypothetical protein